MSWPDPAGIPSLPSAPPASPSSPHPWPPCALPHRIATQTPPFPHRIATQTPLLLPSPAPTFPPCRLTCTHRLLLSPPPHAGRPRLRDPPPAPVEEDAAAVVEEYEAPPLRLLDPPQEDEPYPYEMEAVDPDFYRIGYAWMMRAYGVEFLEGPNGMGVYASRDIDPLRRARLHLVLMAHVSVLKISTRCLSVIWDFDILTASGVWKHKKSDGHEDYGLLVSEPAMTRPTF
ncbi:pollen-specific leucine-rich repeat extensin-like protein 4 [Triticum aestivum]|uniref:pollen-specific leucine-rich repeat extensin-like protein 4 n=1 Tax=Triticum aestivum TaxID=4565 RepID=UPI001D007FE4|nr:pollen-specific leucine-rich repeat extensin-like protein 4 [Triticum aestivum]